MITSFKYIETNWLHPSIYTSTKCKVEFVVNELV